MGRYRVIFPLVAVLLAGLCGSTWSMVEYSICNGLQAGNGGIRVGSRSNGYNRFSVNGSTGATSVLGNLAVNTDKFAVTASSGNTLVAGILSANGGIACDSNKFTVADGTGNTSIAGTFGVTGAAALNGGVACDTDKLVIADGTGELTGSGPKHYLSVPIGCTVNSSVCTGVLVAHRGMTITKASVAFLAAPGSAAGSVTLALQNHDASAGADDNLLGASTFDLETVAAKEASDLSLTGTSADLVVADGDYVYATVTSDNGDMSGGTGGVLTVEYTLN